MSQEELKAYMERLREADPREILAQAFTMLGTGAEVKLGRPDARLLIDAMAALTQVVGGRVSDDLARGMHNGVAQLQMAQVQMEGQAGHPEGGGDEGQSAERAEEAEPSQPGTPPRQGSEAQQESMTDRLWIPGRDPGPPRPRR